MMSDCSVRSDGHLRWRLTGWVFFPLLRQKGATVGVTQINLNIIAVCSERRSVFVTFFCVKRPGYAAYVVDTLCHCRRVQTLMVLHN